jgi:hypothetical protein
MCTTDKDKLHHTSNSSQGDLAKFGYSLNMKAKKLRILLNFGYMLELIEI